MNGPSPESPSAAAGAPVSSGDLLTRLRSDARVTRAAAEAPGSPAQ
ncbi:hypothetical protein ACF1CG_22420 [Streptomyces sp. NPDC014773]